MQREGSEAVDAAALSERLKEFKDDARVREVTPSGSPSRKRPRIYGDRSVTLIMLLPVSTIMSGESHTITFCGSLGSRTEILAACDCSSQDLDDEI